VTSISKTRSQSPWNIRHKFPTMPIMISTLTGCLRQQAHPLPFRVIAMTHQKTPKNCQPQLSTQHLCAPQLQPQQTFSTPGAQTSHSVATALSTQPLSTPTTRMHMPQTIRSAHSAHPVDQPSMHKSAPALPQSHKCRHTPRAMWFCGGFEICLELPITRIL